MQENIPTKNMSQSLETEQSVTDLLCDASSTELTKAMATLSVSTAGTDTDSAASKPFNFPLASTSDASTTPFGSSGGVSGSPLFGACSIPPSDSSPLFGVTSKLVSGAGTNSTLLGSTPESGVNISLLFGVPNIPASCAKSSLFGAPAISAFGASSSSLFGQPSTTAPGSSSSPLFGASSTLGPSSSPLFAASSTPASGPFSSPLFVQFSTQTPTSPGFALFSASGSPILDASNKPAFSTSTSPSFGNPFSIPNALEYGPHHEPFHVSTESAFTSSTCSFGSWGNPECWPFGNPNCGLSNPPFNISTTFQLPASSNPGFSASGSPFGTSCTPPFRAFRKKTTTGRFGSTSKPAFGLCNSSFGGGFGARPFGECSGPYFRMSCSSCAKRRLSQVPSGFTSWSPFWKDPVRLSSICALLACNNIHMSREELRWREYSRHNKKGESNKSAHANQISDADLITIKFKVPSQVATQLLHALRSLHINADSSPTSH